MHAIRIVVCLSALQGNLIGFAIRIDVCLSSKLNICLSSKLNICLSAYSIGMIICPLICMFVSKNMPLICMFVSKMRLLFVCLSA